MEQIVRDSIIIAFSIVMFIVGMILGLWLGYTFDKQKYEDYQKPNLCESCKDDFYTCHASYDEITFGYNSKVIECDQYKFNYDGGIDVTG